VKPISVPAPPKSAFNRNRPVSDLLSAQLRHFQHVAHKQGITIDPILERDIQTESGAARYIAQITHAIRSHGQAVSSGITRMDSARAARKPVSNSSGRGLDLAASAPSPPTKTSRPKKSKRKKP
jgi:hypothetical protein